MSRPRACLLALFLPACGADVAAEMERALERTNDAVAIALVASDPLLYGYSGAPGLRHSTDGPCPTLITDDTVPTDFVADIDYNDGCQPKSGLVPAVMRGVGRLDRQGDTVEASFDGLDLILAYPLSGSTRATSGPPSLAITGEVTVAGEEGDLVATLDLTLGDAEAASLDGKVVLDDGEGRTTVRFADANLEWSNISGECPRPDKGTATLVEDPELVVHFGEGNVDQVMVQRKSRESELVDLCIYESWLFGGRR